MLDGTPILDIKPYLSGVAPEKLRRGWVGRGEDEGRASGRRERRYPELDPLDADAVRAAAHGARVGGHRLRLAPAWSQSVCGARFFTNQSHTISR